MLEQPSHMKNMKLPSTVSVVYQMPITSQFLLKSTFQPFRIYDSERKYHHRKVIYFVINLYKVIYVKIYLF